MMLQDSGTEIPLGMQDTFTSTSESCLDFKNTQRGSHELRIPSSINHYLALKHEWGDTLLE